MPNVVGLELQAAEKALQSAGVLVPSTLGYFGQWPITAKWVSAYTAPLPSEFATANGRIAELQVPLPIFQGSAGSTPAFDTFIAAVQLGMFGVLPISTIGGGSAIAGIAIAGIAIAGLANDLTTGGINPLPAPSGTILAQVPDSGNTISPNGQVTFYVVEYPFGVVYP